MYIAIIIIISILSLFSIWDKIWNFLIKNKKYVSLFLYILAVLSFFYLTDTTRHTMHESWEKALDLLWLILFLPILSKVFNFSLAKKLMIFRKELWILMWVLAFVHSLQYFISNWAFQFWELWFWIFAWTPTYLAYWFIALIISIVLTATSNNFFIKILWKNWKKLHRTVYILLIFTLLHVIFIKIWWKWWVDVLLKNGIPLLIYIIWKTFEWKNIRLRN